MTLFLFFVFFICGLNLTQINFWSQELLISTHEAEVKSRVPVWVCVNVIYLQVKDEVMEAFLWDAVMQSY